jgi:hypothetical protein
MEALELRGVGGLSPPLAIRPSHPVFRLGRRTPLVGPNPPASSGICRYLGDPRGPPLSLRAPRNPSKHGSFCYDPHGGSAGGCHH